MFIRVHPWFHEFSGRHREIGDLLQLDVVELGDFRGVGGVVDFLIIDFLDPVGAQGLHAGGAGHGGGGDNFGLSTLEQGAEVDFRMQHEFLPALAVGPKTLGSIETRGEAVVGGGDHAVVVVKSCRTDLAVRVLGAEAGDMGKSHGVLRNAEAVF